VLVLISGLLVFGSAALGHVGVSDAAGHDVALAVDGACDAGQGARM
jgi:hypothetical protein